MRRFSLALCATLALLASASTAHASPPACNSWSEQILANSTYWPESNRCSGSPTSYKVDSPPSHADYFQFFPLGNGFIYRPDEGFTGVDSFSFHASNADGNSQTVTVTIEVLAARCGSFAESTHTDEPLTLDGSLLGFFCKGDNLTSFEISSAPQHGSITSFNPSTGALVYTPDPGFKGEDSFGFRARNALGASPQATLFVAVGDDPVCDDISTTTLPIHAKAISLHCSGFSNWGYVYELVRWPLSGSIQGFDSQKGTLTYMPSYGAGGPDHFTYRAYNGIGESKEATVTIDVEPYCHVSEVTARPAQPLHVELPCGGAPPLTFQLGRGPEHGSIAGFDPARGTLTYTPDSGFHGTDSFGFSASNPLGSSGSEALEYVSVCSGPQIEASGEAKEPEVSGTDLEVWVSAGDPPCEEDGVKARAEKLQVFIDGQPSYSEEKNCDDPERPCSYWLGRQIQLPYAKVIGTHTIRVEAEDQLGFKAPPVEWTETTDATATVSKVPPDAGASSAKACKTPANRGIATKKHPFGYRIRGNTLYGTSCADIISIQPGVQVYRGEGGDDTIRAGGGNETIKGGAGDDTVFGGRGTDVLLGGAGNDRLDAGVGDDELSGGPGDDVMIGNAGADDIKGGGGDDLLRGGATTDEISGGKGTNTLSYADGISPGFEIGPDSVNPQTNQVPGFPGKHSERGVYVNLSGNPGFVFDNSAVARYGGGSDVVDASQIQNVIGTAYADLIVGSSEANVIDGGPGTDIVRGGGGNDRIFGGPDGDFLDGEADQGGATVHGGPGPDTCLNGADVASCEGSDPHAGVQATPATAIEVGFFEPEATGLPGAGLYLRGSSGSDNVIATWSPTKVHFVAKGTGTARFDTAADKISGCTVKEATADCQIKGIGSIVMGGGEGNDVLRAHEFPTATAVTLLGGNGADILEGSDNSEDVLVDGPDAGDDTLKGAGSDDALFQNEGRDSANGGEGNDLFISSTVCDGDTIQGGPGNDNANWAQLVGPEIRPDDPLYPAGAEPVYEDPAHGVEARIKGQGTVDQQGKDKCGSKGKILNVENLEGSRAADVLIGDNEANYLLGRGGPDILRGLDGNDHLLANNGDPTEPPGSAAYEDVDKQLDCGFGEDWLRRDSGDDPGKAIECEHPKRYPGVMYRASGIGALSTADGPPASFDEATIASTNDPEGDPPLAFFRLQDKSGTTAADWTDPEASGAYVNGVSLNHRGAMRESRGVSLDGVDDYIDLTGNWDPWDLPAECWEPRGYSVEMWVKFAAGDSGREALFSRSEGDRGVLLYRSADGRLNLTVGSREESPSVSSDEPVADEEWHHVVAVLEEPPEGCSTPTIAAQATLASQSLQAPAMKLYVDGFEYPLGLDGYAFPGPTGSAHNLVGASEGPSGLSNWLDGEVDNVSIYDEALSERKVQAHLAASAAPPPEAILLPPESEEDRDADAVPDSNDNCPEVPNPDQADANLNGIGDACEAGAEAEG